MQTYVEKHVEHLIALALHSCYKYTHKNCILSFESTAFISLERGTVFYFPINIFNVLINIHNILNDMLLCYHYSFILLHYFGDILCSPIYWFTLMPWSSTFSNSFPRSKGIKF